MANGEFFVDERPGPENIGGSWNKPPAPPESGSWGGSGGGAGGGGDGSYNPSGLFDPTEEPPRINRTLSGCLLADSDGRILFCRQACKTIPALIAYIFGENTRGHGRCVLAATTDPMRPASSSGWPWHDGTAATVAMTAGWPFGQPGSYRVRARWQRGHYDYAKISRAKFVIYGVSTGWMTLPLSGWTTIATVIVSTDYRLTVNGMPGTRAGNQSLLEN